MTELDPSLVFRLLVADLAAEVRARVLAERKLGCDGTLPAPVEWLSSPLRPNPSAAPPARQSGAPPARQPGALPAATASAAPPAVGLASAAAPAATTPRAPAPAPSPRQASQRPKPDGDASTRPGSALSTFASLAKTEPATSWPEPDTSNDRSLDDVRAAIGPCTRCKLHAKRHNIVFGEGRADARLVFIGEGPGEQEDLSGRPFVGPAGELLTRLIIALGLRREDVFIGNVVKCRPPGNRDPEPDEVATCMPFLQRQLRLIRPEVIVTLGRIASHALLRRTTPITHLRGNWQQFGGIPLMPTLHPSYLLRQPNAKQLVWEDMLQVLAKLGLPPPPPRGR